MHRTSLRRFAIGCLALGACVSSGAPAAAQPAAGGAELLDAEGTALMQEHRYAEACPKLAQSDRLQPGTGVLLRLGLCYQLAGKTASAWTAFHEAAGRARRSNDEALNQLASKRAAALEPRLARVTLRLAGGVESDRVEVWCDGVRLDRSAFGAELPMDPGTHSLRASAPGRRPFARTFVVSDGDAPATIAVDLGGPIDDRAPAPASAETTTAVRTGTTQRTWALVAGGVGVVGVAVGSGFGLAAMFNWNRALSECSNGASGCSTDALSRQSVVKTDAAWSTAGFVVGAAGITAAAILWWIAPSAAPERSAYVLAPGVDGHQVALHLAGRF